MLCASNSISRINLAKRSYKKINILKLSQKRFYSENSNQQKNSSKPFSLTGFIFKLSLLTAAVYGTGATAALIYEPLQEPFLEYFPYGEEVMDSIDYTWKHKKEIKDFDYKNYYDNKFSQLASSVNDTASKLGLENYVSIPHKGIQSTSVIESTKTSINDKQIKNVVIDDDDNNKKIIILSNSDKPAVETPVVETPVSNQKVLLPLITITSNDANVDGLINGLNNLITEFNSSNVNKDSNKLIEYISLTLDKLSTKFDTPDLKKFETEKLNEFKEKFAKEKTDLTLKLTKSLENLKKELEEKHNLIISKEIDEIRKTLELQYKNKVLKTQLDLIENFDKTVSERIESERDNKLKNLESLSERIDSIEKFELQLSNVATNYTTFKEVRKSISKISSLLNSNISSDLRGKNLVDEINNLKNLTEPLNNELINVTINSLPSNRELLLNGGVLTQSQILSRWELLTPELRSVSLLPENPGILGYASSKVFSKFLWSKSGVPIKSDDDLLGNDVESVIARVNNYLQKNQLDDAVEEVTSLKGIPRELANDWLVDTRRKLEIQFLIDLISTEVNLSA